jgi:signal transduction histidine kinase
MLSRVAEWKLPLLEDARASIRIPSRLALTAISAAVGFAVVGLLEPLIGRPYVFPGVVAVVLPALLVGTRYGVLASLLFAAGFARWFLQPRGTFDMDQAAAWALAASTVTNWVVAVVCGFARAAHAQLRGQHEVLDRVHRQREDLLSALTHDVRSPLNAISMSAAALGRANPATERRARTIKHSVAAIDSMLRDLVEIASLEAGALKLDREPVDVGAMLVRLKEGLAGTLPIERVNIAIDGPLPTVEADPKRFERVLVNLLSNALKYSPGEVTVRGLPQGREVVLTVNDRGAGIPPDELPHIFDKYYRAAAARAQQGMGLGLYITRLLVEAHGGRIWADSAPGRGSTFHVEMPATRPAGRRGTPQIGRHEIVRATPAPRGRMRGHPLPAPAPASGCFARGAFAAAAGPTPRRSSR